VIWLAPRHVDKTSAPGSGVPSCKLTAWAEMLAFNDHPARRWEPERLGLLLFSIAARITSHAWRTYYGFPTRTLGAPARRSPGPTSGPALTNLTSHQTDPTREERTLPGPREPAPSDVSDTHPRPYPRDAVATAQSEAHQARTSAARNIEAVRHPTILRQKQWI
jgi:hypothetical protein